MDSTTVLMFSHNERMCLIQNLCIQTVIEKKIQTSYLGKKTSELNTEGRKWFPMIILLRIGKQ